jgi:hypothetical protein
VLEAEVDVGHGEQVILSTSKIAESTDQAVEVRLVPQSSLTYG